MDTFKLKYKLFWWVREHLFFYPQLTGNQKTLDYSLPCGYGDWAVHPCVRYVPDGLDGYHWWMVLSPYPRYDTSKENVLLYRAEDVESGVPDKWEFVKEVRGSHPQGYNSDPNLYYDSEKKELWVIWREWGTANVPSESPLCCSLCAKTSNGTDFSDARVIAHNQNAVPEKPIDTQMCPTVIWFDNRVWLYGSHYSYEPELRPMGICRYAEKDGFFRISDSVPWNDKLIDLWHFDLFEYKSCLYQIVTGRSGNAIYIGKSEDGVHFKYSLRPLYSYIWFFRKNYFYKPSAVVKDGRLFLFFPRKFNADSVRIVVRDMNLNCLDRFNI